ncbi:MAG: TIGR02588 family protein [Leptolyngbya sp. SIO4C5]|uniref:TIGR02588 family protein n=1 Tax=Sphaerothrix gracilis TaxID=3151835 RepID=UPI0013C14F86|nr:TIGR02588 family protein [Leptolyngbya sp. SIO4C5]
MSNSKPDPQPLPQHSDAPFLEDESSRSLAEWTSFAIASIILTVIVGLASYLWLGEPKTQEPPHLEVKYRQVRQQGDQFYVPFVVMNQGGRTVDSVQITAELEVNGTVVESGEQQFQFLASSETEAGAFVFNQNPSQGNLVIRIASYSLP